MFAYRSRRPETQPREAPFGQPLERIGRRGETFQVRFDLCQKYLARRGELYAFSNAVEEAHAQLGFERLERMTEGRGGEMQLCGRRCHAARSGDGLKDAELSQFHRRSRFGTPNRAWP